MKRFLLMGITLGFLLSWAVESIADQPKRGGTLTMAIRKDITLLNPLVSTKSVDKRVRGLTFEPLLGLDRNGKVQPSLAEAWSVSEDGKLYTFKLRKGVKFHNGQEMEAEDVKFSIEYTMNPKNGASGLSDLSQIDRVVVADRHTLKIHLKTVSPVFLSLLTAIRTFSVVPNESLKEGLSKTTAFPPGTGPFKLVEWKPRQRIVLTRHDNYWGHKAFLDKLVLRPISNSTVRFTALRAGDVDMVDTTPFEWVQQVVKGRIKGIGYASSPADLFRRLQFNVPASPFDNKKLRRAVKRKGVKFHNGQEMEAEDVKFSIEYTMNPKNGASGLSDLSQIDRVVVADRHTLKIHLKTVSPVFLSLLTAIRTFSVVPNESLKEGLSKTTAFPPGTGPFKLVEWKPRQRIVLTRHDNYWGHKAFLDKLVLRPISNSTVRFTALRAGDVDMVDTTPFEWVQQVVKGRIKGIVYESSPADIFRRRINHGHPEGYHPSEPAC